MPGLLCLYSSQEDKKEFRNGVVREEPELLPTERRQLRSSGRLVRMPPCSLRLEVFQPRPAGRRPKHTGGFTPVIANASAVYQGSRRSRGFQQFPTRVGGTLERKGRSLLVFRIRSSAILGWMFQMPFYENSVQICFSQPSTVTLTLKMI